MMYSSLQNLVEYHKKNPLKVFQLVDTNQEYVYLTKSYHKTENYANSPLWPTPEDDSGKELAWKTAFLESLQENK